MAESPSPLTVAVTGATGFVGRAVVRELLSRGHSVRALVRDADKARAVLPADKRLTPVIGDVADRSSPARLVAGSSACIHLIGIIREAHGQSFKAAHVEATRTMLDACRAASVSRFLHMSAMNATPDGKAEYQRTKYQAEQLVRRSGLDWTIFRPGIIHGPDGELVGMIKKWCSGNVPPFFFVPFFTRMEEHEEGVAMGRVSFQAARVQPVHVDDVAKAFCEALTRPQSIGEIYNLAGPDATDWKDMLEFFRDHMSGSDPGLPVIGLPARPHAHMAKVAKRLGMAGLFPFDEGQALMAELDTNADISKARAHLNWNPRPFKSSVEAYAAGVR